MNKKGGDWILCPSKSFPGKLYYFNVISGEAAWCLTEEEKKAVGRDGAVRNIPDKNHPYPEPSTPPREDRPDTGNNRYNFTSPPNIPFNYHMCQPQMFGQPIFPSYIPYQHMPGYLFPVPQMFVDNKPETKKRSFDQITQTSDDIPCVQGYTIPMSERFGAYRQINSPTKAFDNKNECASFQNQSNVTPNKFNWCATNSKTKPFNNKSSIFSSKLNSHSTKENINENEVFNFDVNNAMKKKHTSIIKDPVFILNKKPDIKFHNFTTNNNQKPGVVQKPTLIHQEIETGKKQETASNSAMNTEIEHCLKKPPFNTQNSTVVEDGYFENAMRNEVPEQSIGNLISTPDVALDSLSNMHEADNIDDAPIQLDNTDLRLVLQAKKRKLDPNSKVTFQPKDALLSSQHGNADSSRIKQKTKQVTFDLRGLGETNSDAALSEEIELPTLDNEGAGTDSIQQIINISYLKSLAKPFLKTDPWYLVVDIGVLLNDVEFIEDFVNKDITCRLLVPNSVRSHIEALSVGQSGNRSWVMLARKAVRWLKNPGQHVVLQPLLVEDPSKSLTDATIECCLLFLECNHTVLLTTGTELYRKGVSLGIDVFKLDDIKKSIESESYDHFDMGLNVKNNENIFLQSKDYFEAFPLSKNLPANDSDALELPATVPNFTNEPLDINKVDKNNSSMTYVNNTLKSPNKPNVQRNINVNNKAESTIEADIKLLSLHDNSEEKNNSSCNLKIITNRSYDLSIRKVVINTNLPKKYSINDKNQQNLKPDNLWRNFKESDPIQTNNLGNGTAEASSASELRQKSNSLNVRSPVNVQSINSLKEDVHRVKINAYTIDEALKRFPVKDVRIVQRIETRLVEWVCCFYQIMEDCLSDILMNNTQGHNRLYAPWTLPEAVLCLKEAYSDSTAIKVITDKLTNILSNLCDKHDRLKNNIKAIDFMKLYNCGVLLVQSLKEVLPQSEQVPETEKLLNDLLIRIQDPSTDVQLPYIAIRAARSDIDDMECLNRNVVLKKPSEIIAYLKKHFPAWKNVDEQMVSAEFKNKQNKKFPKDQTVVRTFGKQLSNIRINNAKEITFDNTSLRKTSESKGDIVSTQNDPARIVDSVTKDADEIKDINDGNKDTVKVTPAVDKDKEGVGAFDDWIDLVDDETLDKSETNKNRFSKDVMVELDDNAVPFNDGEIKENVIIQNDEVEAEINNVTINCVDSTDDSGFVNQSLDTCSFIRVFLMELSATFKLIYNFIEEHIKEFRCDGVLRDKRVLFDKANETHLYVADIIRKLKRIVDRESSENTKLKSLILNAGIEALTDKRMTRYRQVTMKCLEQAQLLEGALKTMLALSNEHCDIAALDVDAVDCHAPYLNIFE